ncbi:unnamed protein product [Schistocephalus solidus]|uniref:C2H2-type domain-containing protein n=1 Tax=Schistocephalus solidus TaxID=70667 RepID=A0A183TI66_SCHSO|nr:unnamed protein product [Schistocephalus solidus]
MPPNTSRLYSPFQVKLLAKVRTRIRKSQVALGGLAVYCCTDCSLTYARKQSLDRHISVVHHREATFACEYCEFEASDRATFSEHMARHFHLKDVACEVSRMVPTQKPAVYDLSLDDAFYRIRISALNGRPILVEVWF